MKSYKTWWDFYDEDPYEKVGRYVFDAFGHPLIVSMQRISWAYLDWLESRGEADIEQFFFDNEMAHRPSDLSFDDWMEGAVKKAFLLRERNGATRPEWVPPAHPIEYADI